MDGRFEIITSLQYEVKSLKSQVAGFKSGEKYLEMRSERQKRLAEKNREIKKLKKELADAREQTATVRRYWLQGVEDLEKEHAAAMAKEGRRLKDMEERALRAERQRDGALDKLREKNREFYRVGAELEEEKGRNKKLLAQLSRDHENSSVPSSMKPNRKKIPNSREKTGRKPGGQPGHEGHRRKKLEPTNVIRIPAPEKYSGSPHYRQTGRTVSKQVLNLVVGVRVDEHAADEFRDRRTGQRVHAEFPAGVSDDVSYGGSVKAFAFLLNSHCCVSIDKTRSFLSELTDGALDISKGMASGLCREFAAGTQAEREKAFAELLRAPVMGADCTNARVGGSGAYVCVCAAPGGAMYFAREKKGHKGVAGTPVEDHQGTLAHDHDKTFYSYGGGHQECMAHVLRYLKGSMQNEPGLKWNALMRGLVREMVHWRNGLGPDERMDPAKVGEMERRYREILDLAKEEYDYEPPSRYYKEGYNLSVRLRDYMESHLLFLHDHGVPSDNNQCERLLRAYKRKQKQVMAFRSFESLEWLCACMGVLHSLRSQSLNAYKSVAAIFDKAAPQTGAPPLISPYPAMAGV